VQNAIDVSVERDEEGALATVKVAVGSETTEHRVRVTDEDLERYGSSDARDLVRRSFEFLLEREPASSILPEFGISEIERYFPEYPSVIKTA